MYINIKAEWVDVAPANGYQVIASITCDPTAVGKALRLQQDDNIRAVLLGLGYEEITRLTGLTNSNERNT